VTFEPKHQEGTPGVPAGPDAAAASAPGGRGIASMAMERGLAIRTVELVLALVVATAAALVLEEVVGVADASIVYLIAVVFAAGALGTSAAVATSVLAFLAYDFLFTTPRFTFVVSDPTEWLSLLLFLLVAVVIGRLAASLRERAEMADRRTREGAALVAISRDIASAASFEDAAAAVCERLRVDAEMTAVWVTLGDGLGRAVAEAGPVPPGAEGTTPWTLVRAAVDGTSDWIRVHGDAATRGSADVVQFVAPVEDDPEGALATIHAVRMAGEPLPGRGARRLLALAADQLGIALRRDELLAEVTQVEITRRSDALRGAILDSVSHDLRTPIAGIRALAGNLLDPAVEPDAASVRTVAAAIDGEGARLGELVGSLLDMGRIQAGALQPDPVPYEVPELVDTTLRHHPSGDRAVNVEIGDHLPPVLVDAVLFDVALGNVLDNAARHTPADCEIRLRATGSGGEVLIAVDDAGPGVPECALEHLFDRFYRVPAALEPARHGLGMGLAIARGFVEAMGGSIEAERSELGGLGIRIRLHAAPDELAE
jgi:two-component system sensor histidine kinase KdpD